jgi:hypothetical protein
MGQSFSAAEKGKELEGLSTARRRSLSEMCGNQLVAHSGSGKRSRFWQGCKSEGKHQQSCGCIDGLSVEVQHLRLIAAAIVFGHGHHRFGCARELAAGLHSGRVSGAVAAFSSQVAALGGGEKIEFAKLVLAIMSVQRDACVSEKDQQRQDTRYGTSKDHACNVAYKDNELFGPKVAESLVQS